MTGGVVIVEAAARSGALSTANWAGDMYREVLAVPGPVTSSRSVGPHDLIRNRRAELVRDADDVREALGPIQPELPREPVPEHPTDALGPETLRVHEELPARGALGVDELARAALVSLTDCLLALQELEDRGMASYGADGRWSVRLRR
ncbi:MAG: DNA-processing protein DprA [Cutibacterium avidum]|uniref:DNA-processing protein DprA n=1 Tax=Cutibacterium avidum TaxID=33010 RepID=UPI001ED931AF|nr:DNA-processing protein DprA [Cutibacterium avidum]MDK7365254.1 DNA-processing protein DprA [Cutibacterium avidum]MDU1360286.1 DNA-processing protein DprA [Cutibacterium avidum]MDU1726480.1 DNA-processing protein DprA [Cutibacterium avidum]MDU3943000.1 DNA-processing protein DprA [Cutibacterium avidum]MDU5074813.1 DNA-processing protein DprA [Cutibacterium avidum]